MQGRAVRSATCAVAAIAALGGCAGVGEHPRPLVVSHRCADIRFAIYFQSGSEKLTPEAEAVIHAQTRRVGVCVVGTVEVLGLAEAGASTDPLELSQKRATVVAQALAAAGLPAPSFDLVARGSAGSTTQGGSRAPLHRRAEVVLHAAPAA